MATSVCRVICNGAVLQICSEYVNKLDPSTFRPAVHSEAQLIESGGRGGAWFLHTSDQDWVLRHYLRGGQMARFSRDLYFFKSESEVRSFHEFGLTRTLQQKGLPVAKPVAARYERVKKFFYRAQIIVERIPGARTLASCALELSSEEKREVGRTVRKFHEAGLDHADLNCNNILISPAGVYLIDFDKCALRGNGLLKAWAYRNINRLRRSVEKEFAHWSAVEREHFWAAVKSGYHS